jgi:polyferredoxin
MDIVPAPFIKDKPKKKNRKVNLSGPWVIARKSVQYLALAVFLALFLGSRQDGFAGDLINIPLRLDPLLVLSHLLASRTFLASSALALIIIFITLLFGRAWCGWLCPLGTTLDLFALHRWRKNRSMPSEGWRQVKYTLLLIIIAAAVFGNLTLLFLDPLTILLRTLTVSFWPAANQVVSTLEMTLYQVPALAEPVSNFDAWLRPMIMPLQPAYYRDAVLFATLFLGVIGLDLFATRFWCRYLCPLGGFLGLLSKVSFFRRRLTQECKGCILCTNLCPTGTIDPAKGYASDPGECTMCLECLDTCPRGLTTFNPKFSFAEWNEYDPNRRQALLSIGTAVAAVALFRSDIFAKREPPTLLRPPGVLDVNPDAVAFTQCTRCSECIRVCPTNGLQPAVFDAGVEGLGSPVLLPRIGYCDYSCSACGQVCPVGAIPKLSLDDKRLQVIGKAYIDENRCLAWSDHVPCIVCEEMCPLPKKAVQLEEAEVWGPDGTQVKLQLPHVLRDLCIGCGICEYKCPVDSDAAIRIYNAHSNGQL